MKTSQNRPLTEYELDLMQKYFEAYSYNNYLKNGLILLVSPIIEKSNPIIVGYVPLELLLLEKWNKVEDIIIKNE